MQKPRNGILDYSVLRSISLRFLLSKVLKVLIVTLAGFLSFAHQAIAATYAYSEVGCVYSDGTQGLECLMNSDLTVDKVSLRPGDHEVSYWSVSGGRLIRKGAGSAPLRW